MKTVILEIEDSKFEQFMTMIDLLKSDMVRKFEIKKESESSIMKNELLEDLKLFKSGQLDTTEIDDIKSYIVELKDDPLAQELKRRIQEIDDGTVELIPHSDVMNRVYAKWEQKCI